MPLMLIGGERRAAATGETEEITSPWDGSVVDTVPPAGITDVDAALGTTVVALGLSLTIRSRALANRPTRELGSGRPDEHPRLRLRARAPELTAVSEATSIVG